MTYVEVDWPWVNDQLKKAGATGTPVGDAVSTLLDALECHELKQSQLKDVDTILNYVGSLYKGHPIVVESDSESWVDLRGGDVSVRDTVRVKPTAYHGSVGIDHNGKRGRVVAMRNGKISVLYDGESVSQGHGHDISVLQKLHVE